jgi:hypothetical protein
MAVISDPTSPEYMVLNAENKYNTALSASEWLSTLLHQKEHALSSVE